MGWITLRFADNSPPTPAMAELSAQAATLDPLSPSYIPPGRLRPRTAEVLDAIDAVGE